MANVKPTLNQADIELLKGIFLTKDDKKWMLDNFMTKKEGFSKSDGQQLKTEVKSEITAEIKTEIAGSEKRIKKYIHQGVDAAVAGVDNLLDEHQFGPRIKRLEEIHPKGKHVFEN